VGLHCEPLPASILYGYIEQGQLITTQLVPSRVHSKPSVVYYFIHVFSEINMNTSTYFVTTGSLSYVMKLLIIFDIKIYRNLPIFVTHETYDFSWTA